MEHLGLGPGPVVGEALAHLLEIRLDEGELGEDAIVARLDEWWAAHAAPTCDRSMAGVAGTEAVGSGRCSTT